MSEFFHAILPHRILANISRDSNSICRCQGLNKIKYCLSGSFETSVVGISEVLNHDDYNQFSVVSSADLGYQRFGNTTAFLKHSEKYLARSCNAFYTLYAIHKVFEQC